MSGLSSVSGWAASCALIGAGFIATVAALVLSLRSVTLVSEQARLGYRFVRAASPILALGVFFRFISTVLVTVYFSKSTGDFFDDDDINASLLLPSLYLERTATFLTVIADVLITLGAYLFGLALLYNALRKAKFWKLLRLDALSGVLLLLVLDIAYYAKNISDMNKNGLDSLLDNPSLVWLIVIIDATILIISTSLVAIAFYVYPKLKRRTDLALGNIVSLYTLLSLLWLLRCTYGLANDVKVVLNDWTVDELEVVKILIPILDIWPSVAVLLLLIIIGRRPLWSDPAMILENTTIGERTEQQPSVAPVAVASFPAGSVPYGQQPMSMYVQGQLPQQQQQQPVYMLQPVYPGQQPVYPVPQQSAYPGQSPVYPQQHPIPVYMGQQVVQPPVEVAAPRSEPPKEPDSSVTPVSGSQTPQQQPPQ